MASSFNLVVAELATQWRRAGLACLMLVVLIVPSYGQTASVSATDGIDATVTAPIASAATGGELFLAFRMEDWGAAHFHDEAKAKKHIEVLKQLGCEVKTVDHDGHLDVQCRTTFWKSLALKDQAQVDQWQKWFDAFGFDTIHGRPVGTARKAVEMELADKPAEPQQTKPAEQQQTKKVIETVDYRSSEWRTFHPKEDVEHAQTLALYRALGCEVVQEQHNGHVDIKVRAVDWREVLLPTHEAAHQWQTFLQQAGFETRHSH